jgi:hypothetical protein
MPRDKGRRHVLITKILKLQVTIVNIPFGGEVAGAVIQNRAVSETVSQGHIAQVTTGMHATTLKDTWQKFLDTNCQCQCRLWGEDFKSNVPDGLGTKMTCSRPTEFARKDR